MTRKGWTLIVSLVFAVLAAGVVFGVAQALAADVPPPPKAGGETPTPPPGAAEAKGPAEAPAPEGEATPAAPAGPPQETLLDQLNKGGFIGWVIMALSPVALAFAIEHAVTLRRSKLCPPELVTELEEYFDQGQYEEALELCNVERNPFTEIIGAGLAHIDQGYSHMEDAMALAGEKEAIHLQQKISWLALIASVAPMLGLLGTVQGMVQAFGKIGWMTVVQPRLLARDINLALVTTLQGLLVAIPVMCIFQYFSNRIATVTIEISQAVTDLMYRFKSTEK